MRWILLTPLAPSAAMTSAELARRSVAITSAAFRLLPVMVAMCPFSLIFAPMRTSSLACIKRFSKSLSSMMLTPFATQASAMNCACISVGKPGNSVVVISTGLRDFGGIIVMLSPSYSKLAPISSSLSITAPSSSFCV